MFDAEKARVMFYSNETGNEYDVPCYRYLTDDDCMAILQLAGSNVPRHVVDAVVSRFRMVHDDFDYERGLMDTERAAGVLDAFNRLLCVGISAYVDGLSWY